MIDGATAAAGGGVVAGAGVTVISADKESAAPAVFDTRTQNVVVAASAGVVKVADVAPFTGELVAPLAPENH